MSSGVWKTPFKNILFNYYKENKSLECEIVIHIIQQSLNGIIGQAQNLDGDYKMLEPTQEKVSSFSNILLCFKCLC